MDLFGGLQPVPEPPGIEAQGQGPTSASPPASPRRSTELGGRRRGSARTASAPRPWEAEQKIAAQAVQSMNSGPLERPQLTSRSSRRSRWRPRGQASGPGPQPETLAVHEGGWPSRGSPRPRPTSRTQPGATSSRRAARGADPPVGRSRPSALAGLSPLQRRGSTLQARIASSERWRMLVSEPSSCRDIRSTHSALVSPDHPASPRCAFLDQSRRRRRGVPSTSAKSKSRRRSP